MIEPDQYSIFEADADSDILGWNISKKLVGYSIYINVTKIHNEVRIDTMLDFERWRLTKRVCHCATKTKRDIVFPGL